MITYYDMIALYDMIQVGIMCADTAAQGAALIAKAFCLPKSLLCLGRGSV
jgi:hypothetical protein